MASSSSNSREKEFLGWISELNAELCQSSRTVDHGTIETAVAPTPGRLKRFKGKADEEKEEPPVSSSFSSSEPRLLDDHRSASGSPFFLFSSFFSSYAFRGKADEEKKKKEPRLLDEHRSASGSRPPASAERFKGKAVEEKKMDPMPYVQPIWNDNVLAQIRWANKVKKMVENELNPQQKDVRVCILHVPKRLIELKPKSYTPQLLGLGPYHHFKPALQELERFKLAVIAKYLENDSDPSLKFERIVDELMGFEPTICSCYHKYLHLDGYVLATIVAIDGLFLLEFVQGIAGGRARIEEKSFVFAAKKVTEDDFIGDVMMLQNQFPFVLLKLLYLISLPEEEERNGKFAEVFAIWSSFCERVSPFDKTSPGELDSFFDHSTHFLDAMYQQISKNGGVVSDHRQGEREASSNDGVNNNQQPQCPTTEQWCGLLDQIGEVLAYFVGSIQTLIKSIIEIITSCRGCRKNPDEESPVVEEITIPSVTQLIHQAKVGFKATEGGIRDIRFDEEGLILYLPVLKVNANTEIILRNLVAFEAASQYSDEPILEEYTELMCGIVDSPEDVALLKSRKLIISELSNDEVALLFNSISKRRDKPRTESNIDKAVVGVNKYYNGISKVKTKNLMMQWAYASWKGLTVFCTILLLSLAFVQSFCEVYGCSSHFFKV